MSTLQERNHIAYQTMFNKDQIALLDKVLDIMIRHPFATPGMMAPEDRQVAIQFLFAYGTETFSEKNLAERPDGQLIFNLHIKVPQPHTLPMVV